MPPSLNPAKYQPASATKKRARSGGLCNFILGVSMASHPSERQEGMAKDGIKPSTKGSRYTTTIYQGYRIDEPKTGTLNRVLEPVNGLMRSRARWPNSMM